MNNCVTTVDSISETTHIVKADLAKKIPVKVHLPVNVSETVRQQKINKIYDILKCENSH